MTSPQLHTVQKRPAKAQCLLGMLVVSLLVVVSASPAEESLLAFKIVPVDRTAASVLTKQVFWFEASSSVEVFFRGGKVSVPMSRIRNISFVWSEDSGKGNITVRTGDTLELDIRNPDQKLSATLRDLPQKVDVTFPLRSIASCESLDAPPSSPVLPPAGTKLLAKAIKTSNTSPVILLGQVDESGKYAMSKRNSQETIGLTLAGIEIKCPFGSLRSATAKDKRLQLELYDGTVLHGEGSASKVVGHFMGMDIEIEDWNKAEFFWQSKEAAPQEPPSEQPQPGSLLVALFTKAGITSPEIVIAKVDEDGTCLGITSPGEPVFELSTSTGDVTCPVSKIKSITIAGEQGTLICRDGSVLHGKAKGQEIKGLVGEQPASVGGWNKVEFSWRPPENTTSPTESVLVGLDTRWNQRYYQLTAFAGHRFIIETFLNDLADSAGASLKADYRGAELNIDKGCRSYTLGTAGGKATLANGEEVPLTGGLPDYASLFTEYLPSIPARVVIPTADVGEMISGEDAEKSTLKEHWEELGAATSRVAWSITDTEGRSTIVTNLRGYQYGRAYDSPPAGYYWWGGTHRENGLVGGGHVIIEMGKASAHIPLACVEAIDPVKGLAKLKADGAGLTEKLRGFCDNRSGGTVEDIKAYLRTEQREWQSSVLVGDSALGVVAIPISRCGRIERATLSGQFAVAANDTTSVTIKTQTSAGILTLSKCLILYKCEGFPYSAATMATAPYLLVIGKDESSDDPDEYKLAQLVVEVPQGLTMSIPFQMVISGQKKGDLMEISLVGGRQVLGRLTHGSFLGTGVLGQTTVQLSELQSFGIER